MKSMRLCTVLGAFGIASGAHAAMVLSSVTAGSSVTVSGTNGYPNSAAELIVNNVSRGSTKIDGSGNFSFSGVTLSANDKVYVRSGQVWNFNTDGDAEGWIGAGSGATVSVSGGSALMTITTVGNPTLLNATNVGGDGTGAPTANLRVLEFRMRNLNGKTQGQVLTNNATPGAVSIGCAFKPDTTQYHTYVMPLDHDFAGPTTYLNGALNFWLGITAIGGSWNVGDQLQFDYIRYCEYAQFEFDNAGDDMCWNNNSGAPFTVSGGKMNVNVTSSTSQLSVFEPGGFYSKTYFNTFEVGLKATATTSSQDVLYFADGSGGPGSAGNLANVLYTADGTDKVLSRDLSTHPLSGPTWLTDTVTSSTGQMVFVYSPVDSAATPGDTAAIDYIRFGPSAAVRYGPSNTRTVPLAAVSEWMMY